MRGMLNNQGTERRDHIEDVLASLYRILADLDEVSLRINQANRRTPMVQDVLYPAAERMAEIKERIQSAKAILAEYWSAEQQRRWKV